jgi:hypothetical protein
MRDQFNLTSHSGTKSTEITYPRYRSRIYWFYSREESKQMLEYPVIRHAVGLKTLVVEEIEGKDHQCRVYQVRKFRAKRVLLRGQKQRRGRQSWGDVHCQMAPRSALSQ